MKSSSSWTVCHAIRGSTTSLTISSSSTPVVCYLKSQSLSDVLSGHHRPVSMEIRPNKFHTKDVKTILNFYFEKRL